MAHKVDVLLSAGDVTPVTKAKTQAILSIYGNHDDYENLKENCILLKDGLYPWHGIPMFAINGNYAKKRKEWNKTPDMLQHIFPSRFRRDFPIDIAGDT